MKRNLITIEFELNIGKTLSSKNKTSERPTVIHCIHVYYINISAHTYIPEYMYVHKHTDIDIGRGYHNTHHEAKA